MKRAKTSKCANPLFEKWLDEWRQEALARDSPIAHSFRKALSSLRKYPLPLESGRECLILQNFGQKLCIMLDKKLEQHKKLNNLTSLAANAASLSADPSNGVQEKRQKLAAEKKKKKNDSPIEKDVDSSPLKDADYSPVEDFCKSPVKDFCKSPVKNVCSSPKIALDFGVVEISDDDGNANENDCGVFDNHAAMQKAKDARVISLARMGRTESTESSSSTEAYNRFCEENAEPAINVPKRQHFLFTELADSLPKTNVDSDKVNRRVIGILDELQSQNDAQKEKTDKTKKGKGAKAASQKKKGMTAEDEPYVSFFLLPNNFDVILLVDTQETSGGKTKPQDDQTLAALSESGIMFEVRSLKIGDFAWIARCRFTKKELVLPYIVERKRIDDLSSSIIDGRYKEQKFRLKQSGIQNIIYMVEKHGKSYHGSIPLSSLYQASINSMIQDGFHVKYTHNHKDSMRYLATMTSAITRLYESKELTSCRKKDVEETNFNVVKSSNLSLMEFTEFNKAAKKTKNFKVREMFMRQLLQLKGISVDKALAIANVYPTPKALSNAFRNGDENLLAKIPFGTSSSKIGPAISRTLYQFYTKLNF